MVKALQCGHITRDRKVIHKSLIGTFQPFSLYWHRLVVASPKLRLQLFERAPDLLGPGFASHRVPAAAVEAAYMGKAQKVKRLGLALAAPAAVVGRMVSDGSEIGRLAFGLVLGALIIHSGGLVQLTVLSGDLLRDDGTNGFSDCCASHYEPSCDDSACAAAVSSP